MPEFDGARAFVPLLRNRAPSDVGRGDAGCSFSSHFARYLRLRGVTGISRAHQRHPASHKLVPAVEQSATLLRTLGRCRLWLGAARGINLTVLRCATTCAAASNGRPIAPAAARRVCRSAACGPCLAPRDGLEPPSTALETAALPLELARYKVMGWRIHLGHWPRHPQRDRAPRPGSPSPSAAKAAAWHPRSGGDGWG